MKSIILMIVFLVLVGACIRKTEPLSAHAAYPQTPNVEKCRADANAWIADASSTVVANGPVSYLDLLDRSVEMSQCAVKYPEEPQVKEYSILVDAYKSAAIARLSSFVKRKNLYSEFVKEDSAGQR